MNSVVMRNAWHPSRLAHVRDARQLVVVIGDAKGSWHSTLRAFELGEHSAILVARRLVRSALSTSRDLVRLTPEIRGQSHKISSYSALAMREA